MGCSWDVDLAPVERHLPHDPVAKDGINFGVTPQKIARNPGNWICGPYKRYIDDIGDRLSKMIGGKIDPIHLIEHVESALDVRRCVDLVKSGLERR